METIIAQRTFTKKLPHNHPEAQTRSPHTLVADAKLVHLEGNERPYFSLTGEVRNERKADPVVACGQLHDVLLKEWPALVVVERLHLADDDGIPMHAVANGAYWLGFTSYKSAKYAGPNGTDVTMPYFPHFCSTWRVTEDEARAAHDWCLGEGKATYGTEKDALNVLYIAMLPRWKAEADVALAFLKEQA